MSRILILYAHPAPHKSLVNRHLVAAAEKVEGVTIRDLYEIYPDFLIDVKKEQELMEAHDLIVLQHPFYWYSAPSIVKEWMDLVLEHGWAFGPGGTALQGKFMMQAITCGGGEEVYCHEGRNRRSVRDFLIPFEESALLCGMSYLAPFVVYGTSILKSVAEVESYARDYTGVLEALRDGRIDPEQAASSDKINAVPLVTASKDSAS